MGWREDTATRARKQRGSLQERMAKIETNIYGKGGPKGYATLSDKKKKKMSEARWKKLTPTQKKQYKEVSDNVITALTFVPGFGLGAKAITTGIKAGKTVYKVGKKTYKSKDAAVAAAEKIKAKLPPRAKGKLSVEARGRERVARKEAQKKATTVLRTAATKGINKTDAQKAALKTSAQRLAKGAGGAGGIAAIAAIANQEKSKVETKAAPAKVPKGTSKVVPKGTSKVAPKVTSKVAPSLDKLSFGKAFNKSRDEHGGPGGVFTWRGKEYQTNIKGEAYVKNPKSVWKTKPSVKGGRGFITENLGERAEAKSLQTEVNKAWETIKNMKTGGKVTNPARIKSTIRMTNGGGVGSKLIDDIYNA